MMWDYNDYVDRYLDRQEEQLQDLPKCDRCGEPIQDEFLYEIDGETLCKECMEELYRKVNPGID